MGFIVHGKFNKVGLRPSKWIESVCWKSSSLHPKVIIVIIVHPLIGQSGRAGGRAWFVGVQKVRR